MVTWDGTNGRMAQVQAGVYFCKAMDTRGCMLAKIIKY